MSADGALFMVDRKMIDYLDGSEMSPGPRCSGLRKEKLTLETIHLCRNARDFSRKSPSARERGIK